MTTFITIATENPYKYHLGPIDAEDETEWDTATWVPTLEDARRIAQRWMTQGLPTWEGLRPISEVVVSYESGEGEVETLSMTGEKLIVRKAD